MYIIEKFNEEVLFDAATEQEVKEKAIEGYGLEVKQYNGNIVEFEGARHTEEYVARVEAARAEQAKQTQINEIKAELDKIDLKSIRAIRDNDEQYIAQYKAEAQELREQLQELIGE